MRRFLPLLFIGAIAAPSAVSAQGVAIAGHAGTLGVGGSLIIGVSPRVNLKGTLGFLPTKPEFEIDEIDFTADIPTFIRATLDLYATRTFYLSAGGLFVSDGGKVKVDGELTEPQEFGGTEYTGAEVGTLAGTITLKNAMPYLGIGFGNPVGSRVGINLDLGVGLGDIPTVDLTASGPVANDPMFISDLNAQEQEFEDDIPDQLRYYPVVSLSLSIKLGN